MRRNQKGFTLMELMVVIVIVAILAAVAVPLYINYVKDAQRTEAKGAIGAVITAEQTYYQAHPIVAGQPDTGYQTDLTKLNVDLTDVAHNWTMSVSAADANGFTVLATGTGAAAGLTVQCAYTRNASPVWTET
jgi:prepilin-type N-terminal cleavage/methylation domain-containing protein